MTNSPLEVPNELRDFAVRSVEQARKAFEGFLAVAQRAAGDANTTQPGANSVGARVLTYTKQNETLRLSWRTKSSEPKTRRRR